MSPPLQIPPVIRVLLVEDSPSDARLLQDHLGAFAPDGFAFTHVECLRDALAILRQPAFDVLLLDLTLPDCAGLATFLRVRSLVPTLPIILLTGVDDEALGAAALRQGLQDYLVKGQVDGRQLARAIRYAIERKRAEDAFQQANGRLLAANEGLEARVEQRTAALKQRTAQFQALAGELARAEEHERRRVAQVIHDDLQQILVAARFNLETLRARHKGEPCEVELQEVQDLLGESLRVSRSLTADLSPVVLNQAGLGTALRWLARWGLEKHGLTVTLELEEEVEIEAEEIRITLFRAVRELLFNVAKHAQVKSASIRLERTKQGLVRIYVSDSGVGFDPAAVRAREGAAGGFGLFSLRERLESLGGRFEVRSAPGQGSRFTLQAPWSVRLPAPNPAAAARPSETSAPSPRRAAAGRPTRILLVDDHAIVREGLLRALQDEADLVVVGQASNGHAALELARQLRPDVVVMDVSMPKLNGIEATRRLTAELPQVKVIGLSMFDDDSHGLAMRRAGAVAFLDKSGPSGNLVAAIRQYAPPPSAEVAQVGRQPTRTARSPATKPRAPGRPHNPSRVAPSPSLPLCHPAAGSLPQPDTNRPAL